MNDMPTNLAIALMAMFVLSGVVWMAESECRNPAFASLLRRYLGLRAHHKCIIALMLVMFCQRGGGKSGMTNSAPEQPSAPSGQGQDAALTVPGSGGGTGTVSIAAGTAQGGAATNAAPAQGATTPGSGTAAVVTLPGSGTVSVATGELAEGGTPAGLGPNLPEAGQYSGPRRLTANQYAAGFALVTQTVSGTSSWLAMPSNAVVHDAWACYGAARDSFWLPATNWGFVLGTNAVEGALISSSGTLSFWRPKGSPRAAGMPDGTGISFLAPLQGRFGIVPPGGRFWHAATESNSVLFTWQDVYAGRDTNSPVSFQAELFWNGDFTYRYAFPSNSSILTPNSSLTNFVVGAQHNGGGETYALDDTNLLVNGLELRWRAFGMLDPGVDDFDGDGLSDYDEVMVYGTDPRLPDSDFDGLSDSAETASGTDPRNPDTDRDGLADRVDPHPLVWNDPAATNACDGLTYWYKIQHGLDPDADNSLDTDRDGWPDWKELLAGTLTKDNGSLPGTYDTAQIWVPALFDVTVTLNADLPCAAVLTVGSHSLALLRAGSHTLTLKEGEAHPVTLRASRPCTVSLTASLGSPYAALQNPGGVFTGGAAVPGGAAVACGMIAQPRVGIGPDTVCFHSGHPKTVAADVTPPMDGTYHWCWYGGQISATGGKSANISRGSEDNWVSVQFTAAGASIPRTAEKKVTRCTRVDEDTWCDMHGCEHWYCACDEKDPDVDGWCGFHGRKVSECLAQNCPKHHCPYSECPADWCHEHDCLYTACYDLHYHPDDYGGDPSESGGGGGPGDGDTTVTPPEKPPETPPDSNMETKGWIRLNDDDGNKDGSDDRLDEFPSADGDLRPIWPLGSFSGACCPCPEHRGAAGWQAKLISRSEGLKVFRDDAKHDGVSVGDLFYPGDCVYVEGVRASLGVCTESLHWELKNTDDEDAGTYGLDNRFSVLSLQLTGDYNFDGAVNGADRIAEPGLSETYGWGIPVASNSFKRVGLSTQCRLNGVFTLSLDGTAGAVRIWATGSPGSGDTPLLVSGQTVTNGVNGADFAEYGDTVLFIEALSNTTATLTYRYRGTSDAAGIACEASLKMTAWSIEFVHAEGSEVGQPMDELPIFTPCSGTGKGVPIYDCPAPDLAVAFSSTNAAGIRSATMTYLGTQFTLSETAPESRLFTNSAVSASFSDTLLADSNVVETVTATVTLPALGITNAIYACTETNAECLVFENNPYGIVVSLSDLSPTVSDTMGIQVSSLYSSQSWNLTETAQNSRCFADTGLIVRLVGSTTLTSNADTLLIALSDGFGLTNTVFTVCETGGQTLSFRNYDPPVSTDTEDVPVPDFAPWRLKIVGISDPALVSLASVITAADSVSQIAFSTSGGDLLSDQKFIVTPNRTFDAEIPSGYQQLRIDDTVSRWQDAAAHGVGVEVGLYAMASPVMKSKKEKPGAVVLQSLDWGSSVGQGLDPENRIRQPLLEMGYSAVKDYKASVSQTLSDYVKGKQVWYSMSHGGTENGTPYTAFNGLLFRDGPIRASNLEPLDLNYKLAIVDGCCSAQTVLTSEQDARNSNTLSPSCQGFADSFGPDSAYMGWSWKMEPNSAQTWTGQFVKYLKYDSALGRGATVQEAHSLFLEAHASGKTYAPASRNMKIYGTTDNIIEQRKRE